MSDLPGILDRTAVADLAHAYGTGCDDGDTALLRAGFTGGARARYGATTIEGADAIVAWLAERTATVTWSQHVIAPRAVTLDGDRATCRASLLARQVFADAPDTVLVTAGEYRLALTRAPGSGPTGWRIDELELQVGWSEVRTRP